MHIYQITPNPEHIKGNGNKNMRTSKDLYCLISGEIVAVSLDEKAPEGATLWQGYDYERQFWVFEGKKDERTLEELRAVITQ